MHAAIGARMRTAREARGVTQCALAHQLGLSGVALHKMEAGKTEPYAKWVREVARLLDVDGAYLLGLKEEMFAEAQR